MDFDLDRFHAGDEIVFDTLVRTYSPRLLPQLRRYTSADVDAHDLLQDVWLRVYTKRESFNGRGSFSGWLFTVARTVGMDAVRRRARQPIGEEIGEIAVTSDIESRMLRDTLRDALLQLPERQRDAVLLRLIEGMSTAETARRLGCAEGTVKALLHQATRKLREQLKETAR